MRLTDTELISKKYTKFAQSFTNNTFGTAEEIQENLDDSFGGIVHNGRLGWLAKGPYFEIFSLKNGQKIGKFRFDNNLGFERSIITSICEIEANDFNGCLLAIGIQFGDAPGGIIAIYSVQGSKVLRCIEIPDKVTSCHYIGTDITKRTILQMMQGCLAVGTDIGKIILLDTNLLKCEEALFSTIGNEDDIVLIPCHLVDSKLDFTHIREHYKLSIQQNVNFGIELEVVESGCLVLSLLAIPTSLSIAAGLEDGRMILYDLSELQAIHMAYPPETLSPLVKLSFLEPPDDPRPCIYLWAYHENSKNAIAVMHSIMYDKKLLEDNDFYLFEDFQTCYVRLTLPMFDNHSLPINCRSITKFPSHGNEEIISLCLLSWKSNNYTQLLVFDLNQWYKEQMPSIGDWRKNLNYLAAFRLNHCLPYDVFMDVNTIALFNSIQRSEEHFFPISLSFDCVLLMPKGSSYLHWPGLQNRALDFLNTAGSLAILEPSPYFNEIMRASLMPQFCDYSYNSTFTINVQREILLTVALEYNCFGLLKECAKNWADGSHLGNKPSEGLSLSTLTDWAWQRAGFIKNRCNSLCVSLFDHSGYRIDQRNQKELSYLSRQLKLLADLLDIILVKCKDYIPSQVIDNLTLQYNSIRMASEYQEVLQWLLNIGLLPEGAGSHNYESMDDNNSIITSQLVPYPYRVLKNYYMSQRMRFYKINKGMVSARTQSCRVLYIDSFIEHECNPNALREQWLESGGNGLYPPPSLQAMLRTLLVPDVPLEKKYVLFIYLFLDLNMAVEEERHAAIVQNLIKFPAVFKLNASLIKTVQAFWNLDHGQFEVALEEIVSPFSQDKKLLQWQQELLIESLLTQDQPNLALRALQARASPINSLLEIKTLMANDLISEAFHLARSKNDLDLLKTFFSGCLFLGKWCILRDLALTEEEAKLVAELFKESKSSKAGNLHFIYLLQKSKYVEALSYLDELALSHRSQNQKIVDLETPQLILSAYNVTMTPATKSLADCYYKIRNRITPTNKNNCGDKSENENSPKPLSCQLLKQNANNLFGGIYHSSAVSVDLATNYWDELKSVTSDKMENHLLDSNNAPFVRKPQPDAYIDLMPPIKDTVSYPEVYKAAQKRRLGDDESFIFEEQINKNDILENPQKRRRITETNESFLMASAKTNLSKIQSVNSSLLTKFKDRKLNNSISFMDKTSTATLTPNQSVSDRPAILLSTPIVKSCRTDLKDNNGNDQFDMRSERALTPQSILKVKNLIRSETPSVHSSRNKLDRNLNLNPDNVSNASDFEENNSENSSVDEKLIHFELQKEKKISVNNTECHKEHICVKEPLPSSISPASCRLSCPQKRRSIRSANSSILSETSVDVFFSPVSSRDTSCLDSGNNSKVQINIVNELKNYKKNDCQDDDAMDTSELTPKRVNDKEISKDSGADICTSAEMSSSSSKIHSPFTRHDGPKPRRPLSPSKTPPEIINIDRDRSPNRNELKIKRSIRSKTPDIPISPSRRSSRLSTKFEREMTPEKQSTQTIGKQSAQKTLSRIVLESNIMKNVTSSVKFNKSLQKLEEKLDEQANELHKEITSLNSDTEKFQPLISSSKLAATTSMFSDTRDIQTQNRTSEYTTLDGEINFNESLAGSDLMSKSFAQHIATPKSFLPADISMVTDGYTEKNQSLMTTMDMSNISFNSTMFGASENILADSSMEENETDGGENYKQEQTIVVTEISDGKFDETVKVNANVKENILEKKVDENVEIKEDKENVTTEKLNEQIEENPIFKNVNIQILDYSKIEACDDQIVIESNSSETSDKLEITEMNADSESEAINSNSEDEAIELEIEEDNETENVYLNNFVEEQSTNDTINSSSKYNENTKPPVEGQIINISSSSSESKSFTKLTNSSSNESQKLVLPQSFKDISDLLYGDIDKEVTEQDDSDMPDYNELNNAQIYSTSETFTSNITDLPKATDNLESSNTFDMKSDGKNMNFLTGEQDIEQINLNDGRLEETSTKLIVNTVNEQEIELNKRENTYINAEQNVNMSENPLNLSISGDKSDISKVDKTQIKENDNTIFDTTVQDNSTIEIDTTVQDNSTIEIDTTVQDNSTIEIDTTFEDADDSDNILNQHILNNSNLNTSTVIESIHLDTIQSENMKEPKLNTVELHDDVHLKVSDDDDNQNTEVSSVGIDNKKTITNSNNNKAIHEEDKSDINKTSIQSKYNLRNILGESVDKDTTSTIINDSVTRNILRARSVPRTTESSPGTSLNPLKNKIRKRADSTDCISVTPKQIITRRCSILLENIEENSPLDSPAKRTRSKLRLDSIDSDKSEIFKSVAGPSTPTTPMSAKRGRNISTGSAPRSGRAKSVLSEDNSQTPQRFSRRLSLDKDATTTEYIDEKLKEYIDKKLEKKIISDNDSENSTTKKGIKKKSSDKINQSSSKEVIDKIEKKEYTDITIQKNKDNAIEYTGTRRLTRNQKNVMEKSIPVIVDPKTVPLKKRQTKSTNNDSLGDETLKSDLSDVESISSQKSKKSNVSATRRATRSSGIFKEHDDDDISITSSTKSSKSVSVKKKTYVTVTETITESLMVIEEESQESDSNAPSDNQSSTVIPPRKKGRARAKKN